MFGTAQAGFSSSVLVMFKDFVLFRAHAFSSRVVGLNNTERAVCRGVSEYFTPQAINPYWMACPADYGLRIVRIYSHDRGDLHVQYGSASVHVPYHAVSKGNYYYDDFGVLRYSQQEKFVYVGSPSLARSRGYSFIVKNDVEFNITVGSVLQSLRSDSQIYDDLFVLEYADLFLPPTPVVITLTVENQVFDQVTVHSSHDRTHISPYGPFMPGSGAIPRSFALHFC